MLIYIYPIDAQLQFNQGGIAAILAILNPMNNTINGIEQRVRTIEVIMENAGIVKRNQSLRDLGPVLAKRR